MVAKSGLAVVDNYDAFISAVEGLTGRQVLVGVPEAKTEREPSEDEPPGLTNAALAYIHNTGAPEVNIPQREFMHSGIKRGEEEIVAHLREAARLTLEGDQEGATLSLRRAGAAAQKHIQMKIREGPFAPLSKATIAARRSRHKGRKAKDEDDVTPLIDTTQMLRSITYVLRKRGVQNLRRLRRVR